MFKGGLFCCAIFAIIGMTMAQTTYTLYSRASGANAALASKVELITATATAPDVISIQFAWTYGAAPDAPAAFNKALTICCVDSLLSDTDPVAASLKDKCFGMTLEDTTAAGTAISLAAMGKVILVQGVKSGTNFHPGSFINPAGYSGSDLSASVTAGFKATSAAYSLNSGELTSIGLLISAATTINFSCNHADFASAGNANDFVQTSLPIPSGTATTFSIVGTGTTSCKTSTTTTTSSATFKGILPIASLASILAFSTLF